MTRKLDAMARLRLIPATLLSVSLAASPGCFVQPGGKFQAFAPAPKYDEFAAEIEYPTLKDNVLSEDVLHAQPPRTLSTQSEAAYWDVSLEEVVRLALEHSEVLRDLGGAVIRAPGSIVTAWDPAITETDPNFGVEAALSEFDAQFSSSLYFEKNDRALNNEFFGGGTRLLQQDAMVFQAQIAKRAATGSEFAVRHNVDYDANNAPGNQFPSAWNTNVEAEIRHPLLQGAGPMFNRIAGPNQNPGEYNGVLIARINTDVDLADFEIAVRDLVSNIENTYWDLYFAYRDLDAKVAARDAALDTWRRIYALYETGRRGGEAEKEAQAREQYFSFEEEVQNALSGRLLDGTRTGNGSLGGTFRATGGVYVAERRLRLLVGLPVSDGHLLRPSDEPAEAEVSLDWDEARWESTSRRAELRRQRWMIRRRELELMASKNYLLPRLDAIGRYRWRGFGKDLLDSDGGALPRFDNAYEDLTSGDFQEWQLGLELSVPIGYRRAHSAVRNAELLLTRARAVLKDQERQVVDEMAGAIAEMDRAFAVSKTSYNRLIASQEQLAAVTAAYEVDEAPLDQLLDAQRRLATAKSNYYRTLSEYAVALKNVHFTKGTLLEYDGVFLSEGPWPRQAYVDAAELERRRGRSRPLNYVSRHTPIVNQGTPVYPNLNGAGPAHGHHPMPIERPWPPMVPGAEFDTHVPPEVIPLPPAVPAAPAAAASPASPVSQASGAGDPRGLLDPWAGEDWAGSRQSTERLSQGSAVSATKTTYEAAPDKSSASSTSGVPRQDQSFGTSEFTR